MPSDADQIRDLEEELDALDNPTTAEVLFHTRDYDAGIVAAIGVQRGTAGGGGGGSQPSVVVKRIDVDFNWPNTPTSLLPFPDADIEVGDVLIGYLGFITEAFDGTTPHLQTFLDDISQPIDNIDAASTGVSYDTGYVGGLDFTPSDIWGFSSAQTPGIALVTGSGEFLLALHDGSNGDPGSTQGVAEYWFVFYKKPT